MNDMKKLLESLNEFQGIFPMFYFEDLTGEYWRSDGDTVEYDPDGEGDWGFSCEIVDILEDYQEYFICNIDLGTGVSLTAIFDKSKEIK